MSSTVLLLGRNCLPFRELFVFPVNSFISLKQYYFIASSFTLHFFQHILCPADHILVDSFNHTNYVLLAPVGLILVNLVTHNPQFVLPVNSWSHFGKLNQTQSQFRPLWQQLVTF
jgi:hypothetical protein